MRRAALFLIIAGLLMSACSGGGGGSSSLPSVRSKAVAAAAKTARTARDLCSGASSGDSAMMDPGNTPTPSPYGTPCSNSTTTCSSGASSGDSAMMDPGNTPTPSPYPTSRLLVGTSDCATSGWLGAVGDLVNTVVSLLPVVQLCTPQPGQAACHVLVRTDLPTTSALIPPSYGYRPADLVNAYKIPPGLGNDQTVVVVDAYDNPSAENDLAVYRSAFGLPACTSLSGCFSKITVGGGLLGLGTLLNDVLQPAPAGWSLEIALDLDMVSAACPGCDIVLVEAKSNSLSDLTAAVDVAVSLNPAAISNSYYIPEGYADQSLAYHYNRPGMAMTAASGDAGYGANFPASLSSVIAVGGTTLWHGTKGWQEKAWRGTGSGCSRATAKPWWQRDFGCSNRMIADIGMVADPMTGVLVYDTSTPQYAGWSIIGGTSVGAPIIAALFAGSGHTGIANGAQSLYSKPSSAYYDVIAGSNGACSVTYFCTAVPGYDGPTGLGAPIGLAPF